MLFVGKSDGDGKHTLHYILKDHLGSWTTITDCNGAVEQELSYDAWGNRRDPETWCVDASITPMFDRGYTGHEHLYGFGLINMNGRMYDPVMSSFLSVDRYVQEPENSQGFNRYAYCMYNPLKYIDPSGWTVSGGSMGSHTTGAAEWGTNYAPVYEPRDLYSPFARGDAAMALLTSYRVGNCFIPVFLEGGGGGCSNSGDGGDNPSMFYNDHGRCLGSINDGNGKLYVLRAEDTNLMKKRRDIKRFFKGKSSSINADEIYQYFIEIESSKENRQRMYEIVSADDGTGGSLDRNNREYGGYIKNGVVFSVDPGPVGDPRIKSTLEITIPYGYSSFHSHASGYIIERDRTDVGDNWWRQKPSDEDIDNAGDHVHYVFGRWNKCVYIYDKNGTQAILRDNTFLNIGP